MKFLVEATDKYVRTNTWDGELSKTKSEEEGKEVHYYPKAGERWEVDFERKEKLVELGFVKVVKEIEDNFEEVKKNIEKTAKAMKEAGEKTEDIKVAPKDNKKKTTKKAK